MNDIPVIFTHRGPQDYVRIAIEQAKRRNDHVVLLGNEENAHLDVEHYDNADYWQGAAEIPYRHMSGNHEELELYCLQIYFVARNLARDKGWDKLFLIDSDVMLYTDVTEYEKTLGDYDLAINWCERQEPYRWSACLHNSFWKLETLEAMCDFIMAVYSNAGNWYMLELEKKWAWHQTNDVPGGVCDMTLLHFFRQRQRAVNLSRVRGIDGFLNCSVWDDNINVSENYEEGEYWELTTPWGGKEIWRGSDLKDADAPFYLARGWPVQYVRANALHFQGQAKGMMEEYEG